MSLPILSAISLSIRTLTKSALAMRALHAADRAVYRLGETVVDVLRAIRLGDRSRLQVVGKVCVLGARTARVPHVSRHCVEASIGHGCFLCYTLAFALSMIPKSGHRFSDKIMLQ
jgi:hypothetical protein